jgi:hypothetical protein
LNLKRKRRRLGRPNHLPLLVPEEIPPVAHPQVAKEVRVVRQAERAEEEVLVAELVEHRREEVLVEENKK